MSRASTNSIQGIPSIVRRRAEPYWRKEVAHTGLEAADIGESAAATGGIVAVNFKARARTPSSNTSQPLDLHHTRTTAARLGPIDVSAQPSNQFNVASGHVLTTVAGTAAWVPYESTISRGVAQLDDPNSMVLPVEANFHEVAASPWDRLYTQFDEVVGPYGSDSGQAGWVSCFSEEAPTQQGAYCIAFSVPLPRAFTLSGMESAIQSMRLIPDIGEAIADRLRELRALRSEESDAASMSVDSIWGLHLALNGAARVELPRISLTADGNIYATWRARNQSVFSVHFLSQREARYALIRPDPQNRGTMLRSSGSAPADAVFRVPETAAATWAVR